MVQTFSNSENLLGIHLLKWGWLNLCYSHKQYEVIKTYHIDKHLANYSLWARSFVSTHLLLSNAACMLQCRDKSWVTSTGTVWPKNPKTFIIWPFLENVSRPWYRLLLICRLTILLSEKEAFLLHIICIILIFNNKV